MGTLRSDSGGTPYDVSKDVSTGTLPFVGDVPQSPTTHTVNGVSTTYNIKTGTVVKA